MNEEWISVDKYLPCHGETVIFCTNFGTWVGWIELPIEEKEELQWYSFDDCQFIDNVTHWMPLPEPYFEEENEGK